jgi:glucose-6-phosphate-specific signal transduction histidine kinase
MCVMAAGLSIVDWIVDPALIAYDAVIGVLHIVCVLLIAIFPQQASLMVIGLELICCFHAPQAGTSRLWGVCLAIGILAYETASLMVCLVITVCAILFQMAQISEGTVGPEKLSWGMFASFVAIYVISAGLGYGFRWRHDRDIASVERNHERMMQQEKEFSLHNSEYAAEMHDVIGGKLNNAALLAQRSMRTAQNEESRRAWEQVNALVLDSLEEIHSVIDRLTREQPQLVNDATLSSEGLTSRLKDAVERHDQHMHQLGFEGAGVVNDYGLTLTPDEVKTKGLFALIGELYANIAKHCPEDGTYLLSVTLCDDYAEIAESNPIAAYEMPTLGGKGLALYAQRIEMQGGKLHAVKEGCDWNVFAHVPLR